MKMVVAIGASLWLLSGLASAQHIDERKGVSFGVGCVGGIRKLEAKFGTCLIAGGKTRLFCPNGQVFDRVGEQAHISIARSTCGLTQKL